jgi:2-polyprenyl-6-methoxyphenol hydroxylase-like FAD-dependent oxidoreductase
MKIIIIGAGIAGLTAAIALKKRGFQVHLYEAAPELLPIGAGIVMASNAMQIFQKLDFADEIKQAGNVLSQFGVGNHKGRYLSRIKIDEIERKFGQPTVAIHRGILQQVLKKQLDLLTQSKPVELPTILLGKKLIKIEENQKANQKQNQDKVVAHFEDGTSAEGDILIGADGVRSVTRKLLWGEQRIRQSGQACWRGIVNGRLGKVSNSSEELPDARNTLELWGKTGGKRVAMIQVNADQIYFFYTEKANPTYTTDSLKDPRTEKDNENSLLHVLEGLKEFPSYYSEVIGKAKPEHIYHDDLWDLLPLQTWHKDRVLLIGDAAHASTPNLGQGGCQAVEDAWYLSELFAKNFSANASPDSSVIEKSFADFEVMRRPKINFVVNTSWQIGKLSNFGGFIGHRIRNFLLKITPDFITEKQFEKLYRLS